MADTNKKKTTKAKVSADSINEQKTEYVKPVAKEVDPHQYITVLNGFEGSLVYKSSKTGEVFTWGSFGDEQEMELGELRNARNSQKGFFINNWFMFGDEFKWVIDYLGVGQYYANAIDMDKFDDLFNGNPDEVSKIISKMSDGQKNTLYYKATYKIASGEIDSNKMIAALEKSLGVDLVERN